MGSAAGTVFVAIVVFAIVNFVEWWKKEPIIKYEISAPTPPADGKILERPSIKVRGFWGRSNADIRAWMLTSTRLLDQQLFNATPLLLENSLDS